VNRIPSLHPDRVRPRARVVRFGAGLAGIAGALVLAGCSGNADAQTPAPTHAPAGGSSAAQTSAPSAGPGTGTYADGTYTAEGQYATPETVEKISVTVTLQDDIVTDVEVTGDPQTAETRQYQGTFIGGIADAVVGKDIDDLSVSRVAGSSLTSGGFNEAIDEIKSEAAR